MTFSASAFFRRPRFSGSSAGPMPPRRSGPWQAAHCCRYRVFVPVLPDSLASKGVAITLLASNRVEIIFVRAWVRFTCNSSRLVSQVSVQAGRRPAVARSEEHTSELQSRPHLVCRLLLEKKKLKYR